MAALVRGSVECARGALAVEHLDGNVTRSVGEDGVDGGRGARADAWRGGLVRVGKSAEGDAVERPTTTVGMILHGFDLRDAMD